MERINLEGANDTPYQLFENLNVQNNNISSLTGNLCTNDLSKLFFSQTNIDYLQDKMIEDIFRLSGKNISKQSDEQLIIVMRSIYFQHGRNMMCKLQEQIEQLNEKVLEYCVPNIHSNLKQYVGYIKEITSKRELMEKPQNVGIKGFNQLEGSGRPEYNANLYDE